ncbi:MAG: hypothetical protein COS95_03850 [Ignavibacteriales bacterium CG07_land_8_20_14_0_80_59_12]|nr:MAG: hypothetical protein COS95_03850 [Ignavibacteriales bacterium CG07_land_8_20_14_0_80_59_12]
MRHGAVWTIGFALFLTAASPARGDGLSAAFTKGYGQVEIGGHYVGAEFHHSRPLPSRISFYYPVANSIDLSTDYWRRDESRPFRLVVESEGRVDTIGAEGWGYRWTPFSARFGSKGGGVSVSYRFCDDLPVMVCEIELANQAGHVKRYRVSATLAMTVRTCQTYAFCDSALVAVMAGGRVVAARFDRRDTDSAAVFFAEASSIRRGVPRETAAVWRGVRNPTAHLEAERTLRPGARAKIVLLIGSCRGGELGDVLRRTLAGWESSAERFERTARGAALDDPSVRVRDASLMHTAAWSRAILATARHYLRGELVPMPCPAEYNFFFTHDLLLTDLGAVLFDTGRVRRDLLYLRSLSGADSVLPHAYYWRDDRYVTEPCGPDNWNHFWFIIVAGSYLRHSGDIETIRSIFPLMAKSLALASENLGVDGVMYAFRPDWWDIGRVYGARAFTSSLMVRTLEEFAYVAERLGRPVDAAIHGEPCRRLADRIRNALVGRLWSEKEGYLFNTIDTVVPDRHYYMGSLVAAVFNVIDREKSNELLKSARRELLDGKLGIRNVMPADFDTLISRYRFNGNEAGGPYEYANGGVWPHGNVWYAVGLMNVGELDEAYRALRNYLTLEGVERSPRGQPSFYEYRYADPHADEYGRIDKPTFLWAGGLYLYALYHLCGVREEAEGIWFDPHAGRGLEESAFDLMVDGERTHVRWRGRGPWLRRILVDGREAHAAVVSGAPRSIVLERGVPAKPYVASATVGLGEIRYDGKKRKFLVGTKGGVATGGAVVVVSPSAAHRVRVDGSDAGNRLTVSRGEGAVVLTVEGPWKDEGSQIEIEFR